MKRKLVREQTALSQYFEAMLGDKSISHAAAGARPTGSFECLAFHVRGLMLAIPRTDACGVVTDPSFLNRINRKSRQSRLQGQSWLLGVLKYHNDEIMTMDIAEIAIPPEIRAELVNPPGAPAAVILVQDGRMGVICDNLPVVMIVTPEEVCWSRTPKPCPWLAGVIAKRCALLDATMLCAAHPASAAGGPVCNDPVSGDEHG